MAGGGGSREGLSEDGQLKLSPRKRRRQHMRRGKSIPSSGNSFTEIPRWKRMWFVQGTGGASSDAQEGHRQVERWVGPAPSCRFGVRGLEFFWGAARTHGLLDLSSPTRN